MRIGIEEIDDLGSYEVELEERVLPGAGEQTGSGTFTTWRGSGPTDSGWIFARQGTEDRPPCWFVSDQSGLVYDAANEVAGRALDPVPSARTEEDATQPARVVASLPILDFAKEDLTRIRTERVAAETELRFDGIYQSDRKGDYWQYVRFYTDGTVLTVSSSGSPSEVLRWFRREEAVSLRLSHGRYVASGNRVSFSSTGEEGVVDYEGTADGVRLKLSSYSHINGRRGSTNYHFVQPA